MFPCFFDPEQRKAIDKYFEDPNITIEKILDAPMAPHYNQSLFEITSILTAQMLLKGLNYLVNTPPPGTNLATFSKYAFNLKELINFVDTSGIALFFVPFPEEGRPLPSGIKTVCLPNDLKSLHPLLYNNLMKLANETGEKINFTEAKSGPDKYPVLEKLLNFFIPTKPKNPVQFGHCIEVLTVVMSSRKFDLFCYVMAFPNHLNNFIENIEHSEMANVLQELFTFSEIETVVQVESRYNIPLNKILKQLFALISSASSAPIVVKNAAQVLSNATIFQNMLARGENIMFLFSIAQNMNETTVVIIAQMFTELFPGVSRSAQALKTGYYASLADTYNFHLNTENIVKTYSMCLELFVKYLLPDEKVEETRYGQSYKPCGPIRISIVNSIFHFVRVSSAAAGACLGKLKLMKLLFSFFEIYGMNSCLHYKIYGIFSQGINSGRIKPYVIECDLPIMIMEAWRRGKIASPNNLKVLQKPYFEHLMNLANEMTNHSKLKDYLKDIKGWDEFMNKEIKLMIGKGEILGQIQV